jgi:sugar lactone lactonase YvrE
VGSFDLVPRPEGAPSRDNLGEGPFWSEAEQALYWVDIAGRRAHRHAPATGEGRAWTLPAPCAAIIPAVRGGHVVALQDGLHRFDLAIGAATPFVRPDADPGNRSNETVCDPQGRIWLGTMFNNIGPNGEALPVARSSGAYYCADPLKNVIWSFAYDPDGPVLSDQRVFVEGDAGSPDGAAVDEDGCLWNARWGAGRIVRYRPEGRFDRVIELPVLQPSSCAFGGPDLKTLFVTSARFGMESPGELDGAVLALRLDVAGLPMAPFAG